MGELLARLALRPSTRTVLDPMAGHGDLLVSAIAVAKDLNVELSEVVGIEVDPRVAEYCDRRVSGDSSASVSVSNADAFEVDYSDVLDGTGFDLVIANPPYVRYQLLPDGGVGVRRKLRQIVHQMPDWPSRGVWLHLVDGYSGHADLSVPAWILAALLTRPGGRLAIVAPSTWRTRDYAQILRYLMARSFEIEVTVSDSHGGWFPDALVRTELIIARRLERDVERQPVHLRKELGTTLRAELREGAGTDPADLASFITSPQSATVLPGLKLETLSLSDEWQSLSQDSSARPWFKLAEEADLSRKNTIVSERSLADRPNWMTLDELGVSVGQGLRSGCNDFFYVTELARSGSTVTVRVSRLLGGHTISVPSAVLAPIFHRQLDVKRWRDGEEPKVRVLCLQDWILPEHAGSDARKTMPMELADHVRRAATVRTKQGVPIPQLSAVKTNASPDGRSFWYSLPRFTERHCPDLFVARVNHGSPNVEMNTGRRHLVDANFSTVWTSRKVFSTPGLFALLSSAWFQLALESAGTTMGGGALKLEATQIRRIRLPRFNENQISELNELGAAAESGANLFGEIDKFVLAAVNDRDTTAEKLQAAMRDLRGRRGHSVLT